MRAPRAWTTGRLDAQRCHCYCLTEPNGIMWRRTLPLGLSLIVGLLCTLVPEAVAAEVPRVRLITTGGTISNRPGERLSPAELIASVPDLDELVEAQTEEFANVSSNSLTLEQWLHLSRRLNAVFAEDPDLAGIVLTSGTDTLEELAYFLLLTVPEPWRRWHRHRGSGRGLHERRAA